MFMLRALEVGLRLTDLDLLSYGEVLDIVVEKHNDRYEAEDGIVYEASGSDFD